MPPEPSTVPEATTVAPKRAVKVLFAVKFWPLKVNRVCGGPVLGDMLIVPTAAKAGDTEMYRTNRVSREAMVKKRVINKDIVLIITSLLKPLPVGVISF